MRRLSRATGVALGLCAALHAPAGAQESDAPPVAYVIPQQQPDQAALKTFLQVLVDHGVVLRRALAPFATSHVRYSAGTYVVVGPQVKDRAVATLLGPPSAPLAPVTDTTAPALAAMLGVGVAAVRDSFPIPVTGPVTPTPPRYPSPDGLGATATRPVAVFVPGVASRPLSWTRATLDRYGIVYSSIDTGALAAGSALRGRFDVVLLPDAGATPYAALPPAAAECLRGFVDAGGTLVAVGTAARWTVRSLRLPGRFDDLPPPSAAEGGADSALVGLRIDRRNTITSDMVAHAAAWVAGGPGTVFVPDTTHGAVVARYDGTTVLAGAADVGRAYDGAAAVTVVPEQEGRVVLFAFDPLYRGVSVATFPLLWSALRPAVPPR